ncbi:MAG TPA: hypothetical protein VNQ33_02485 [Acidimicrobiales bacterium]|nr:hypothetical protein [Acidimicrobiales bacterium]
MTDDLTPGPFEAFDADVGERMHAAADHLDGAGVTRSGVAAAVDRRRRQRVRSRALAAGAAAAVAVVGGMAIVTRTDGHGPDRVISAASTTVPGPCAGGSIDDPVGWFRLTAGQAARLEEAGAITADQAADREQHAVLLTYRELQLLDDDPDLDEQLFQLGYEDAAGIGYLRAEGLLTPRQEASVDDGLAPVLVASQVDRLMQHFPDLAAVAAGGDPFSTSAPEVPSGPGRSAFGDGWIDVLRSKGLLTPAQEAAAAAGDGFTLSPAQRQALQEQGDQQAAGTTTTALSFAPGSSPATTEPDPCDGQLPAAPGRGPQARATTSSASAQTTTTT